MARSQTRAEAEDDGVNETIVPVGLPSALPFPRPLSYRVPVGMTVAPGDWVEVPLQNRTLVGVVWDEEETAASGSIDPSRLKHIGQKLSAPPMRGPLRKLVDWVARYTVSPHGAVLRMAVHLPALTQPDAPKIAYRRASEWPADVRITAARQAVLDQATSPLSAGELAASAGTSTSVVRSMADAGLLERLQVTAERPLPPDLSRPAPALSSEQQAAADHLCAGVRAQKFSVDLLDGVTGSGKTEVYFEAIAESLRLDGQVLVLLPEIALTAQWLQRFRDRFGTEPVVWHSEIGGPVRRRAWRSIAAGHAKIVVGARSALFLPFSDLRAIVVDEEHDHAFKQEDGVRYHARDMAIVRACLEGVPVCLASATPSLETMTNVERGRFGKLALPSRFGGASLPSVEVIDLVQQPPPRGKWISPPLADAVTAALARQEQSLLFLNRRGYAPLTLCRTCGHRFACKHCEAWLVEHRYTGRLQCHHCGYSERIPPACPTCNATESLAACGPGVERIAEEVAELWPDARTVIMSSDLLHGPKEIAELVGVIQRGEADIIVGTQLIAKGHHFPNLTQVGIVDADLGLAGGDLRAAERTFHLLTQVAGRAGRENRPGTVYLQTTDPSQPVLQAIAAADRDAFYRAESSARRDASMPPYGRLASVIVTANDLGAAINFGQELASKAPFSDDVRVLGPAPAPISLVRGRHRVRLLLHAARTVNVPGLMHHWLSTAKPAGSVRVSVDVDPYSFL